MEAVSSTHVKVTITMSLTESNWLRALMQNPVKEPEEPYNKEQREKFFTALQNIVEAK